MLLLFYFGKCKEAFLRTFICSHVLSQDFTVLLLMSYILKFLNSTKGIFRNIALIFGRGHLCWSWAHEQNIIFLKLTYNNDHHLRSAYLMPDIKPSTFICTYSNLYNQTGRYLLPFPFIKCQLSPPKTDLHENLWIKQN